MQIIGAKRSWTSERKMEGQVTPGGFRNRHKSLYRDDEEYLSLFHYLFVFYFTVLPFSQT
jgi:hypothetical protein